MSDQRIQNVFTDISMSPGSSWCGYAVYFGDDDPKNTSGSLRVSTVQHAETRAIECACEIIARDTKSVPTQWVIHTDCLSCLNTISFDCPDVGSQVDVWVDLIRSRGHTISLLWIRRLSMLGNVKADAMAREAGGFLQRSSYPRFYQATAQNDHSLSRCSPLLLVSTEWLSKFFSCRRAFLFW